MSTDSFANLKNYLSLLLKQHRITNIFKTVVLDFFFFSEGSEYQNILNREYFSWEQQLPFLVPI